MIEKVEIMQVLNRKEKLKEVKLLASYVTKKKKEMTQKEANEFLFRTGMYTKNGTLKKQFK